jgi:hypothetical protein
MPMDAIAVETRKKITLTFLFLGLPCLFLILGGTLLTPYISEPLRIGALIAGFAVYVMYSIRAGKIYTEEARQREAQTSVSTGPTNQV